MRRIAAITVTILCLMTGAALAQEDLHKYDSQCLRLANLEATVCTYGDGTGLAIESNSTTHYTAKEWARLLPEFIEKDKEAPGALERKWQGPVFAAAPPPLPPPPPAPAQVKPGAITDKKQCKAAGFTWSHGTCSAKDAK
jgi:hypothetical protein